MSDVSPAEIERYVDDMLARYPGQPLVTYMEILGNPPIPGTAAPLSLVKRPCCGLERRMSIEEAGFRHFARDATPLILAVMAERSDMVADLLAIGADTNAKNKQGNTALHIATDYGDVKSVVAILKHSKQSLNAQNERGFTALHMAALDCKMQILKFLIEAGANLELRDIEDNTPLVITGLDNDTDGNNTLELLTAGARVDVFNKKGETPLHVCASYGLSQNAVYLLAYGADVNATDVNGNHPLHNACSEGLVDNIKVLLDNGADLDVLNGEDMSPFELVRDPEGIRLFKMESSQKL